MPRIAFVCILFLSSAMAWAQQVKLTDVFRVISKDSGISFSYDAELLKDVTLDKELASVEELIQYLETNTAIRLEALTDDEYLITPKKSTVTLRFGNTETSSPQEFYIDIVRNNNEVLYQNFVADPQATVSFEWTPRPNDTIKVITTAHDPVHIPLNELLMNLDQEVRLTEKVTYLDEVVIQNYLAKGINLDVPNQVITIKMSDLALIPGETDGDVLAALATLPGINTPDSRPGNLFIRGSSADQNFLLYNNIPIYHRGHYFGSISPYNPAVISNVTVSKNGYNPRLGGRVGGAIEIRSQDELREYSEYGVGLNSLYGNAFMKTRISDKVGVSLAGRHSLPSGFISPKLVQISDMVYAATALTNPQSIFDLEDVDVVYQDYNMNVLWAPNDQNKIKASGLYTDNSTEYVTRTDTTANEESFAFDNQGVSLEWDRKFNQKIGGKLVSFYSNYGTTYSKGTDETLPGGMSTLESSENQVSDAGLSYEVTIDQSANSLSIGASTQWTEVRYTDQSTRPNMPPLFVRGKESGYVNALFSNYRFNGAGKLYFQLGGRLDYYSLRSAHYFSPRVLVNYDVNSHLIFKASGGRYYQYLNQIKYLQFGNAGFDNEIWRLSGNGNIQTLHSDQFMVGGILTKGAWVLDVEAYQKRIGNVNYSTTYELNPMTDYAQADWDISGIDFFTKLQIFNGVSMWGSYEYSEQTITFDTLESVSYNYKYNRPHRFKLGGLYQHGRWKVSFSWKILSGLYGRSLDIINELDQIVIREFVRPPPPPPGTPPPPGGPPPPMIRDRPATLDDIPERYPAYKGLDLFITYELPKTASRKWSANIGLSLINVFNYDNQIDQVVRGDGEGNPRTLLQRNAIGFAPNLNLSIKW